MSRLNIPFSTNQKTRPVKFSGRVLWLFSWLFLIFFSVILANLWFNRDSLSSFAPKDTEFIVHLNPTKKIWVNLLNNFGTIPLISGNSLTFNDLLTINPKEITIFYLNNNETALAIRAQEQNIPKELLNSLEINVQKIGTNRWFLSRSFVPISTKSGLNYSFSFLWPTNLGVVYLDNFKGKITGKQNSYSLKIPQIKTQKEFLSNLPDTTIAALVIKNLADLNLSSLSSQLDLILKPLETITTGQIIEKIKETGATVILAGSENQPEKTSFIIEANFDQIFLLQILKTAASLQNPILEPLTMPDNSVVQEILIKPEQSEINTFWINGLEVKGAEIKNGQILALYRETGTDIIASDQQILEKYLNNKEEEQASECKSTEIIGFLKPNTFNKTLVGSSGSLNKPNLFEIINLFKEVSLESNKINFCL